VGSGKDTTKDSTDKEQSESTLESKRNAGSLPVEDGGLVTQKVTASATVTPNDDEKSPDARQHQLELMVQMKAQQREKSVSSPFNKC
jgi:hypothetical protein